MSSRSRRVTPGFTLVELLVALVIAGLVALMAHRIYASALDATVRLQTARRSLDQAQGARRLLTAALLSIETGGGAGAFEGRSDALRCDTWLQTADGWFERTAFSISRDRDRLVVQGAPGKAPIVIAREVKTASFDYLLETGAEARWVREWISEVSAPLAVRLRVVRTGSGPQSSDTTLYLIRQRG